MTEKVHASHILLAYQGAMHSSTGRSKEDAMSQIKELQGQLATGGNFGKLASQHSDCPSGEQGGDLGGFGRGMMAKEFEEASFALEIGATSDVVETAFGYHLIQRTA